MTLSKYAYIICVALLAYANLSFYPKWKKGGTEAALSWDVCGYYYYLPAVFIYKDVKKVAFIQNWIKNTTIKPCARTRWRGKTDYFGH